MVSTQLYEPARPLHCDDTGSVMHAIEESWRKHHSARGGEIILGLYAFLNQLLTQEGFVVDATDGLEILEHCRRRNLPIVDILYVVEDRVRESGYAGDRLSLADFSINGQPVYVFYNPARFTTFDELKTRVAQRVAMTSPL